MNAFAGVGCQILVLTVGRTIQYTVYRLKQYIDRPLFQAYHILTDKLCFDQFMFCFAFIQSQYALHVYLLSSTPVAGSYWMEFPLILDWGWKDYGL